MTEHEHRAGCASEAEVVEGMAVARYHGVFGGVPWELLSPVVRAGCLNAAQKDLTAARALGCLMPDEAAALSDDRDMLLGSYGDMRAQRDALAARLKVAEEALRGLDRLYLVIDSSVRYGDPLHSPKVTAAFATARAALTPAKGDAP